MTRSGHIHPVTQIAKRAVDVVGACVGLSVTALAYPAIALAIKLDSRGPVLFRQERVGEIGPDGSRLFQMIKFRTMSVDAEAGTGAVWATKVDARVTRVGRFLRKTRLDELPQFVNVLRGEMSLIGPRPERPTIAGRLDAAIPYYAERLYGIKPGITGLAQVHQGYDRDLEDVRSKIGFDHAYALALGRPGAWLSMEISILWRTLVVMVGGRGQ